MDDFSNITNKILGLIALLFAGYYWIWAEDYQLTMLALVMYLVTQINLIDKA